MPDRLRAMFCDHLSIMRGKYLPAAKMRDDESRFAQPTFSVHYDKDLLLEAPGTTWRCAGGAMTSGRGGRLTPAW
jgi:glutamine synthetase